jgi:hypothetical protein
MYHYKYILYFAIPSEPFFSVIPSERSEPRDLINVAARQIKNRFLHSFTRQLACSLGRNDNQIIKTGIVAR